MAQAFEVPILPSFAVWDREIAKRRKEVDKFRDESKKIEVGTSSAGAPKSMGARGPSMSTHPYYVGPNQRLAKAERWLEIARGTGDSGIIGDAQHQVNQAQRAVERMKPKTQEDLLMDAFMTSRIGRGGQLFPLVNRLKAAGLSSEEGAGGLLTAMGADPSMVAKLAPTVARMAGTAIPMLMAAGVVTAAVTGVVAAGYGAYQAAETQDASIRRLTDMYWQTGGSMREVGQLAGLGGNPGNAAMQFSQFLSSGGFGPAFFRSQGIVDYGFFTPDKATNFLKGLKAIMDPRLSDLQASNYARGSGLDDYLWMRNLDQARRDELMGGMKMTPEQVRLDTDYRYNKQKLGNSWDQFVRNAAPVVMGGVNAGLDSANTAIDIARTLGPAMVRGLPIIGPMADALGWTSSGGKQGAKNGTDKVVDAIKDLGRTLKDGPEAVGGGARFRGALPAGWKGVMLSQNQNNLSALMGGFEVG